MDFLSGLAYPGPEGASLPNGFQIGSFTIAFYAICILFGALVALFLGAYYARKDGYSWDFFVTIFIVAFPLGIVGARIWYVIAEWPKFASDPIRMFFIHEGGLAIQGGAILGVLSGVVFAMFRRRGCQILKCMDYAVPGILVAQAIGRWGNFFNQEVYGRAVSQDAWAFLPSFIENNMTGGAIGSSFVVPLFLVEGLLNISFFFLMVYGYKGIFKKFYKFGDLSCLYFVSYGLIRMIMEPMRNSTYIMGQQEDTMKSFTMALLFIVAGVVCLILNHVLRYMYKKGIIKDNKFIKIILRRNDFENKKEIAELSLSNNNKSSFISENKQENSKSNINNIDQVDDEELSEDLTDFLDDLFK